MGQIESPCEIRRTGKVLPVREEKRDKTITEKTNFFGSLRVFQPMLVVPKITPTFP